MGVILTVAAFQAEGRACPEQSRRDLARKSARTVGNDPRLSLPALHSTRSYLLAVLLASSYANLLGYRTEVITRAGVLSGLVVAATAFAILLARQKELPPQDFQQAIAINSTAFEGFTEPP